MKQLSLRNRLYVLILIVLIPLLLLQFLTIITRYNRVVKSEIEASQDFAEAVSVAFNNYLRDLWSTEYSMALAITSGEGFTTSEGIEQYMRSIERLYPGVGSFLWVSSKGEVKASTKSTVERGKNLADREYIKRILWGEEQVISDIIVGDKGEILLPVARAVRHNEKLLGIIIANLDTTRLDEIFPVHRGGETAAFGFVDRKGRVAYHSLVPDLSFEKRQIPKDSPIQQVVEGQKNVVLKYQSSITGDIRMGVYLPILSLDWIMFVSSTRQEVLRIVFLETVRDILILVFVTAISLWVALKVGSQFLRPIQTLQQTAQAISQGELAARTLIQGNDELAVTGQIFDEMAERIEQLEISRTRFLQTAAHELRNPMAGIKGLLSLVRRRMAQGKPLGDITQMLEVMDREIDRLSNLLNQIIEAFRTQRDKAQLSLILKKVNLVDVVFATLKPFQLTVNKCNFLRDIDTNKEIWVAGDSARLEEVIRNLLSNAVKYSPSGGDVIIRLTTEDEYALLAVKDQGIGIPKEQVERIFDCFYRASNLEKQDPGGMGLGLYICKEIIEGHDGLIWAESEEGVGSTFLIKLPLYKNREEL